MNVAKIFLEGLARSPSGTSIQEGDEAISYEVLHRWASAVARSLPANEGVIGVMDDGTASPYAGLLGTLLTGRTYVPLNSRFPSARIARMIELAGLRTMVLGPRSLPMVGSVARGWDPMRFLLLGATDEEVDRLEAALPRHEILAIEVLEDASVSPVDVEADHAAYVMFTSGTTGVPKGVMNSHRNVAAFMAEMTEYYDFTPADRFVQLADLTFDLSVFPMFASWSAGATLHIVPPNARMMASRFLDRHQYTVWTSVPSVAMLMREQGHLVPGRFPSLRHAFFCGEPLPVDLARAWAEAAPNSQVDNHYGPTETTVAITVHRWAGELSESMAEAGVTSIGHCYPGSEVAVVDEALNPVPDGSIGELCFRGDQVAVGYWNDSERTKDRFVSMPWWTREGRNHWYRTGDLGKKLPDGSLVFAGRSDQQTKILGYRVELPEIEAALRRICDVSMAVAVPVPVGLTNARGVVGMVPSLGRPEREVLDQMRGELPAYMVPMRIVEAPIPRNQNEKVDRVAAAGAVAEAIGGKGWRG